MAKKKNPGTAKPAAKPAKSAGARAKPAAKPAKQQAVTQADFFERLLPSKVRLPSEVREDTERLGVSRLLSKYMLTEYLPATDTHGSLMSLSLPDPEKCCFLPQLPQGSQEDLLVRPRAQWEYKREALVRTVTPTVEFETSMKREGIYLLSS